jgi:large subunit ribosomal protein L20
MSRVKGGTVSRTRRKRVLKLASGYFGAKHILYRTAQEQLMHSWQYAFNDRRDRKSNFRKLWIKRINAACRLNGLSYNQFIFGLKKSGIEMNRKMLSELAIHDVSSFKTLVETAKKQIKN